MTVNLSSVGSLKEISLELCEIAQLAGKEALAMRDTAQQFPKGELDSVTEADLKAQEIIILKLAERYPGIPVVAEEQEAPGVLYETFFAVDPIDGTVLYSRNGDQWGIMIGLVAEGHPVAGTVYLPVTGEIIRAARGSGCYFNNRQITLNQEESLKAGIVGIELGWWLDSSHMSRITKLLGKCRGIRSNLAFAGDVKDLLLGVTCGIYHQHGAKIWDFAAGTVAIAEAGGVALDGEGKELRWDRIPMDIMMASSSDIAEEILIAVSGNV